MPTRIPYKSTKPQRLHPRRSPQPQWSQFKSKLKNSIDNRYAWGFYQKKLAMRECLRFERMFKSESSVNRICKSCRGINSALSDMHNESASGEP
jgi:hypothetical protein